MKLLSKSLATTSLLILIPVVYPIFIIEDKSKYYYIFSLIALVLVVLSTPQLIRKSNFKSAVPLFLFVALCFISSGWSLDPALSLRKSQPLLIFILMSNIIYSRFLINKNILPLISVYSTVIISVIFIYLYLKYGTIRFIGSELESLSKTTVSNSNAAYLVIGLPFLLYSFLSTSKVFVKYIYLFVLVLSVASIILSQSRGAYLAAVFAFVSFIIFYSTGKRNKKITLKKLVFVTFVLLLLSPLLPTITGGGGEIVSPVIDRITQSSFLNNDSNIDIYRQNMLSSIIDIVYNYPIGGIGFEAFSSYSAIHYGVREFSHNIFLTASEVGVFGIIIWVYVYSKSLKNIVRAYKQSRLSEKNYYLALSVATVIGLGDALFRPQLQNIFFIIVISVALGLPKANRNWSLK